MSHVEGGDAYKFVDGADVEEGDLEAVRVDVEEHAVRRQEQVPILDLLLHSTAAEGLKRERGNLTRGPQG